MHWLAGGVLFVGGAVRLALAAFLLKAPRNETRTAGLWIFTVEAGCLMAIALLLLTGVGALWAVAALFGVGDIVARVYFRRRVHAEPVG